MPELGSCLVAGHGSTDWVRAASWRMPVCYYRFQAGSWRAVAAASLAHCSRCGVDSVVGPASFWQGCMPLRARASLFAAVGLRGPRACAAHYAVVAKARTAAALLGAAACKAGLAVRPLARGGVRCRPYRTETHHLSRFVPQLLASQPPSPAMPDTPPRGPRRSSPQARRDRLQHAAQGLAGGRDDAGSRCVRHVDRCSRRTLVRRRPRDGVHADGLADGAQPDGDSPGVVALVYA